MELSNGVLDGVIKSSLPSLSYIVVGGVIADEYVYVDDVLGRGGGNSALSRWACGTAGVEEPLDLHLQVDASEVVKRVESESGRIPAGGRFSVERLDALVCL